MPISVLCVFALIEYPGVPLLDLKDPKKNAIFFKQALLFNNLLCFSLLKMHA